MIVGGVAVRFYVPEREADDLDVMIEPTLNNARRVLETLQAFGMTGATAADLAQPGQHISFKRPCYLDILTPREGFSFETMLASASDAYVRHGGLQVPIKVASKDMLVALLAGSEHEKHAEDIRLLRGDIK